MNEWIEKALVLALIVAACLPPALKHKSVPWFFGATALTIVGILLPLFVFFMSVFLAPEWKGGCHYGWVSCFHVGKLALSPLVLFGAFAFYVAAVYQPKTIGSWVHLHLASGAWIAGLCFAIGVAIEPNARWPQAAWYLVPAGTAIGYGWWFVRTTEKQQRGALLGKAVAWSIPFWLATAWMSRRHYLSLPEEPPTCFIVSAAAAGHPDWVGPWMECERAGQRVRVNRQLATFWALENVWRARHPKMHRRLRQLYNALAPGPAAVIAGSPLLATGVHLALRPAEMVARRWITPGRGLESPRSCSGGGRRARHPEVSPFQGFAEDGDCKVPAPVQATSKGALGQGVTFRRSSDSGRSWRTP